MTLQEIVDTIEAFAPPALQEAYDNAGWQVGNPQAQAQAALLCIDVTPSVMVEAKSLGCNLVIAHHPLLFRPLKSITGAGMVEKIVMMSIKEDIAIYAAHTNIDSVEEGVSYALARRLGIKPLHILAPANPALPHVGLGVVGELAAPMLAIDFLQHVRGCVGAGAIRHTSLCCSTVQRIALCGGAGGSLIPDAIAAGADLFITGEVRYHDYFAAENRLIVADIGHYESEQFTKELFCEIIRKKFHTFAVHFSTTEVNPINYL